MTIIWINYTNYEKWRNQIEVLINKSAIINFSDYEINENYGRNRCNTLADYLKEGKAVVMAAIEEDALLGWLWCHDINRIGKNRLHIAEIAVNEEYRLQGVGNQLLKHVEQYAAEKGYSEIDLLVTKSNQAAVRFYEKAAYDVERYLMKKVL